MIALLSGIDESSFPVPVTFETSGPQVSVLDEGGTAIPLEGLSGLFVRIERPDGCPLKLALSKLTTWAGDVYQVEPLDERSWYVMGLLTSS